VDLRRASGGLLARQAFDGFESRATDLVAAETGNAGAKSPIQAESGPMQANHGFGLHHDERIGSAIPNGPQRHPEQTVSAPKTRAGMAPFEDGELLA
jgi:hypothetical protein